MILHTRLMTLLAAIAFTTVACSSASVSIDEIPTLPETSTEEVLALLKASDRPVVLNVWASWCGPCRSEAPLLREAAAAWNGDVRFVGVDVRDTQEGARAFIAEFGLEALEHFADPGGSIPARLGGSHGVPLTFFFAPGGDLIALHHGVIDERTLALQIDELLRGDA